MVITLPLFQAFPQRTTNIRHHSLLVYRADSHWITYLTFPLSLSQEYWWKADHAPFKACYVISRRKVRSSCSSRRCRRLLSNLVQFCAEREREREGGGRKGVECGHCQGLDITSLFFHAGCLAPHYQQGYAVSCGDESSLD